MDYVLPTSAFFIGLNEPRMSLEFVCDEVTLLVWRQITCSLSPPVVTLKFFLVSRQTTSSKAATSTLSVLHKLIPSQQNSAFQRCKYRLEVIFQYRRLLYCRAIMQCNMCFGALNMTYRMTFFQFIDTTTQRKVNTHRKNIFFLPR